jgi:hypothetical protein
MDKNFASLLASPLFNLSLSSKELFHSNFLYWIGKNYPLETGEYFSKFCNDEPEIKTIISVKREKENIDFSFEYTNGQKVIIENKVKSLPYLEQLKKYSTKHDQSICYILLSLSKPSFVVENGNYFLANNVKWNYLSYSVYDGFILSLVDKVVSTYHKELLIDYSIFIMGLIEIEKASVLKLSDKFDFHSISSDSIYKSLIELRLQDFYLKRKYESLCYLIYLKTKESDLPVMNFGEKPDWDTDIEEISFGSGMTNSQGLSDIKYKVAPNVIMGIQIQGESFRLFIEDKDGMLAHKIKDKLLENNLWFIFDQFGGSGVYPKGLKGFNKYGNTFYYKSVKLGISFTVDEIVNIVFNYLMNIKKNLSIIKDLIRKSV